MPWGIEGNPFSGCDRPCSVVAALNRGDVRGVIYLFEGCAILTAPVGLLMLVSAVLASGKPGQRHSISTSVLALTALGFLVSCLTVYVAYGGGTIVPLRLGPGFYVTVAAALLAGMGGLRRVPQQPETETAGRFPLFLAVSSIGSIAGFCLALDMVQKFRLFARVDSTSFLVPEGQIIVGLPFLLAIVTLLVAFSFELRLMPRTPLPRALLPYAVVSTIYGWILFFPVQSAMWAAYAWD
jgi:hypothetical protein